MTTTNERGTMREIETTLITEDIAKLCQDANYLLPQDVEDALKTARDSEESLLARETLDRLLQNAQIAREQNIPLCQDCGVAVVILKLGQDVHITGGDLYQAVEEGVRRGYTEGYLRKSIAKQPFSARTNTKDNTPPVIHTDVVPGDRLRIIVMPKGGGSENMSRLAMLTPAQGRKGVVDFVVQAVEQAGSNPCPPVIVGVGIGGTADRAVWLAKETLLRPLGRPHPEPELAELEKELLQKINALGIGPQGFGGRTTALAVHIEVFPAHIASLPVAVNIQCHSARHKESVL